MGTPAPTPEASLDALLKLASPLLIYFVLPLIQRRKLLLSMLQAVFRVAAQQEDEKRTTQEIHQLNGNGDAQKTELVIMNLEQVLARIGDVRSDTEREIAALSARQDRDRKDWLTQIENANAEYAKLSHRLEVYKRDTDKEIEEIKAFEKRMQRDMRQGFDNVMEALRDLKPPTITTPEVSP